VEADDLQDQPQTPTAEAEVKTFDSIIKNLRTTYPTEKMSEISTSFCFICLLHLANEEGLRIEADRFDEKGGEDEEEKEGGKDRIVGELQALRVYRDVNAGRGA
jgi:condensin complex subunit 2